MSRVIIESGSQISLGGHMFQYLGQNADGIWLARSDDTGAREVVDSDTLFRMIRSEAATIIYPSSRDMPLGNVSELQPRLHSMDDEQWRKTFQRWAFVQALAALQSQPSFSMSDRGLQEHANQILDAAREVILREPKLRAGDLIKDLYFPSTRTLRRWWMAWSKTSGSMMSLINRRSLAPFVTQKHTAEQLRFLNRACELFLDPKELSKRVVIS